MPRPRVDRSAFLYFDPRGKRETYAQCETCMMWTGRKGLHPERCSIHGSGLVVHGGDTCGLYVHGTPMPEAHLEAAVTPRQSGFERRQVRCENCRFYNTTLSLCELFKKLNHYLPGLFDLEEKVDAYGCCNANTPKGMVE